MSAQAGWQVWGLSHLWMQTGVKWEVSVTGRNWDSWWKQTDWDASQCLGQEHQVSLRSCPMRWILLCLPARAPETFEIKSSLCSRNLTSIWRLKKLQDVTYPFAQFFFYQFLKYLQLVSILQKNWHKNCFCCAKPALKKKKDCGITKFNSSISTLHIGIVLWWEHSYLVPLYPRL